MLRDLPRGEGSKSKKGWTGKPPAHPFFRKIKKTGEGI
jgi:hypothetical protein